MSENIYKLDSIFEKIKKNLKITESYDLGKVWEEVVGDIISHISLPVSFYEGKLTVSVKDPIWMNQLNLMKKQIIPMINQKVGKELIKDIKFKVEFTGSKKKNEKTERYLSLDDVELKKEDLTFIENSISPIKDDDLRESLKKLFTVVLKRRYLDEKKEGE